MTTQWPLVRARLVTLLPTLPAFAGVLVYDGPPSSADQTASYVAVGYAEDERGAGTFSLDPEGSGFFDIERGEVRSEVFAGNGDGALGSALIDAFALVDALKASIKADRTLGVLPAGSTTSLSADVLAGQDSNGAGVLLVLSLAYTAPLT